MRLHLPLTIAAFLLTATPAYASFSDVSATHPNYDAIIHMQKQGIVSGYPDETYRPNTIINRAEFTKIIIGSSFNASDLDRCSLGNIYSFVDIDFTAWYARYLCVAVHHRMVSGYLDHTFQPNAPINFAEAAKIIAVDGYVVGDVAVPNDQGGPWYEPYVRYLELNNAIPLSITRFDQLITRGEMAEMIYRLYNKMNDLPSQTYEGLQTSGETLSVTLYFGDREVIEESDCGATKPVKRTIAKTPSVADATLRLLFQGATPQERAQGYSSDFDWDSDGMGDPLEPLLSYYRGVTVVNGIATVKFTGGAMAYLNNTSCMQEAVKTPIFDTLMQFPSIKSIQFSVDGEIITEWDA